MTLESKAILNFPLSGTRHLELENTFFGEGQYGALWTSSLSTVYSNYPDYISFVALNHYPDVGDATTGRGVRCIKAE